MKWFMHDHGLAAGEAAAILAEGGLASYGAFMVLVEHLCGKLETRPEECEFEHTEKTWAHILHCSRPSLRKHLAILERSGLVTLRRESDRITLGVPKLYGWGDEYTKKRRRKQESVRADSGEGPAGGGTASALQERREQENQRNTGQASAAARPPPAAREEIEAERKLRENNRAARNLGVPPKQPHESMVEFERRLSAAQLARLTRAPAADVPRGTDPAKPAPLSHSAAPTVEHQGAP